jgi:hypothetical protein
MAALDQHHAHAAIKVGTCRLQHRIATARIEFEGHARPFLRRRSARIGKFIAR